MGHRNSDSIWLKRVLIPFWVVRVLFMLILIGIYAAGIAVILAANDSDNSDGTQELDDNVVHAAVGAVAAVMVVMVLCLLLDIVAMGLFCCGKLKPKTFLIFNVIQTLLWVIIFVLQIVGAARGGGAGGIIITIVVLLAFIGLLIYASVIYHRSRKVKRGYVPAENPGAHTTASYNGPSNQSAYEPYSQQVPVPPTYHQGEAAGYYSGPSQQQQYPHSPSGYEHARNDPVPYPQAYELSEGPHKTR